MYHNKRNNLIGKIRSQGLGEVTKKCIGYLRGWFYSIRFLKIGRINVRGPIRIIKRHGTISVGEFTTFWPNVKISCYGRSYNEPARLDIGDWCSIGDRTEIHCGKKIMIGKHVIIAWDCVIMDRDYHSPEGTLEIFNPVVIEDNVWIGCRSIILKGVIIGEGAIVAAGSVVTHNAPPHTLVAGNPARVIKEVAGWH